MSIFLQIMGLLKMNDGIKIQSLRDMDILFYSSVLCDLFVKQHKGSKTWRAQNRGKSSSEDFCVKSSGISFTSSAALWIQSAGSCSMEKGLRRISSMQWFVGFWWRHTTPNFIVKGTYAAIDQNVFVIAGITPELSWYFKKDLCCFLWYEIRIN